MSSADFFAASNVLVVAGKGGVGKTTVGAALAVAAASGGCHVLLVALEGYSGLGSTFGVGELGLEPHTVDPVTVFGSAAHDSGGRGPRANGPMGQRWGRLDVMQLRPDDALAGYLARAGLGPVVNRFTKTSAVEVVATAAPGIRDLVTLGKIRQMEQSGAADLIIVDAPASGHAVSLLTSAAAMADSADSGPIRDQADQVLEMLADDSRCQVLLVTLAEETPVTETVETAFAIEDRVGVQLGPVIVNGVWPEIDGLAAAVNPDSNHPHHRAGRFRLERNAAQRRQIERLADELPLPQLTTPYLFQTEMRADGLAALAGALAEALTGDLDSGARESAGSVGPGDTWRGPGAALENGGPDDVRNHRGAIPEAEVVLCLGPGGVGKTTVSAAFGMALARAGKRVVILTIDPARRLADALGLASDDAIGSEPVLVEQAGRGRLWATMLDPAETFERVIRSEATSAVQAQRILDNRLFKNLANSLSGTSEYMAVERLHQLNRDDRFDVVVVDTPPSRHVVDFLDSPGRLTRFVDHRLYRSVFSPGSAVLRGVSAGGQLLLKVLGRMVGAGLVNDVVAFFAEFQGLDEGFRRRAAELQTLLEQDTAVVVVAAPRGEPLAETAWILERINERIGSADLLVVNRATPVTADPTPSGDGEATDTTARPLSVNIDQLRRLARAERTLVGRFLNSVGDGDQGPIPTTWLDERAVPVRDLDSLSELADDLSGRQVNRSDRGRRD